MSKCRISKLNTLLYDCFLIFAFIIAVPKLLYKRFVHGKYTKSLKIRFGLEKPQLPPGTGPVVWFHGASVGEIYLLVPVIKQFMQDFPEWRCVVTACTESGHESAQRLFSSQGITTFILPLDLSIIIKPVVRAISPALVVFSEGDCWLNFVEEAKRVGATAVIINGKLSANSSQWFTVLKRFGRNYFSPVDGFMVQDETHKARFLRLGVSSDKVEVTGNIKTYTELATDNGERNTWREKLKLSESDELIVLGSTHTDDVNAWLPAIRKLNRSNLKVLWVPRHKERVKDLENLLTKENTPFGLWSQGATFENNDAVIVDVVGLLKQLYFAADIAFVGGTFDAKVGGHNLLEPLQSNVPLIFGPYIKSQSDLAVRLLSVGAGYRLDSPEQIAEAVAFLLDNPQERAAYVEKGNNFLYGERESFYRTWESLKRYIPCVKI
ncbi:lipid IV(A) 3-deoxy-D-manno-octulosonic acid transferase [Chlamydia vaughanii]|uniref:lipid IV(A) 3-deoxy-D-manno-octulosonic acid transferase n=1 Tax=Chlamydia vaughanii TaxID=3112552 RepID=UPI0032B22F67